MSLIKVVSELKPTENPKKVKKALLNLFPDLEISRKKGIIGGKGSNLEKFKEKLKEQKIRTTARTLLMKGREGNSTKFYLNKQAAWVGKINFVEPELAPLGPIEVIIKAKEIDKVIDELTELDSEPFFRNSKPLEF
jgi:hypothetical protein